MAVVIRLARVGRAHDPKYRITVADSRRYVTSKYLDIIGHYIPTPSGQEKKYDIDADKAKAWMSKGAKPTERVQYIFKQAGIK